MGIHRVCTSARAVEGTFIYTVYEVRMYVAVRRQRNKLQQPGNVGIGETRDLQARSETVQASL